MMLRTKRVITWNRSYSAIPGPIVIPAGAPVIQGPAADGTPDLYWVKPAFFKDDALVRHDATTHGCRVDPDNVEEVPA